MFASRVPALPRRRPIIPEAPVRRRGNAALHRLIRQQPELLKSVAAEETNGHTVTLGNSRLSTGSPGNVTARIFRAFAKSRVA